MLTVVCGCLVAQESIIPAANPARPTVTIPASLPPVGYLQFEQGVVRAGLSPGGTASQIAVNQTTKVAVTDWLMVQAITTPYAHSILQAAAQPDSSSNDPGDVDAGIQVLMVKAAAKHPAIAAGYIRRARVGTSANIDVGEFSQAALVQIGGDLRAHLHYDTNFVFDEQSSGPMRRAQFLQTLAVSRPIALKGKLGSTIELSHFTQPFPGPLEDGFLVRRAHAVDVLFVATFAPRPNLIFDASVDHGFTSTSTHWQDGFGISYLLPHRLWRGR